MNNKNTIKINKNFSCFITNETDHLNLINKENKKSKTPKNLISIHKQKIINNKKNLSERLNKSTRIKNRINLNKITTKKNSFESDKNKLGFKSIKLFKRDFIDNSQKIKFQNELNGEIIYFSLYNDNDIFNLNEIYNENFNINLYDEEESSDDEKILSGRMFQLNEIGKEIKKMKK
jgi:hypothetical protein